MAGPPYRATFGSYRKRAFPGSLNVATISDVFAQAWQHYHAGDLPQAEQLCRRVLHADSRHADAHHLLGIIAYRVGRFDLAVNAFRQALSLSPSAAGYYSNLGMTYGCLAN